MPAAAATKRHSGKLITLQEAADLVGVHARTLRRYISTGRIEGYRIGPRLVKVDPADLDKLKRPIPTAGR